MNQITTHHRAHLRVSREHLDPSALVVHPDPVDSVLGVAHPEGANVARLVGLELARVAGHRPALYQHTRGDEAVYGPLVSQIHLGKGSIQSGLPKERGQE